MNKNRLLVLAIVLVSAVAAGVWIVGSSIGPKTTAPSDTGSDSAPINAQNPRNYIVNVTDSVPVADKQ